MEIFLIPGNYLLEFLAGLFGVYEINPNEQRVYAFLLALFVWVWLFRFAAELFAKHKNSNNGNPNGGNGHTIEKSLGWLAFIVAGICALLAAPFLYGLLAEPLFNFFAQTVATQLARFLSWGVIGLSIIALHFFIQSGLHGFLLRQFVKRMSS